MKNLDTAQKSKIPKSLMIAVTSLSAVLYFIGISLTAYIPSPWGFGQFRPAVVVPAFFATVFGPLAGGLGAAIGTLMADSLKHGQLYVGSLISAVPGNFIGFYLFGYILKRKFTWGRFVLTSNITLVVANAIVGFLYVFAFKMLYAQSLILPPGALTFISIGLTIYWYVTMLPFVLILTPVLIQIAAYAFPSLVSEEIRMHSLREELPKKTFSSAMITPGILMLVTGYVSTVYAAEFGNLFSLTGLALTATQILFIGSGVVLSLLGILTYLGTRTHQKPSAERQETLKKREFE